MNNENIFSKHKFLIGVFLFIFLLFMFFHYKFHLGLFFDMPAMLFGSLSREDYNFSNYLIFHQERVRFLTSFLIAIPFNIFVHFVKNITMIGIVSAFSLSYIIIQFFGLILNYIIALRTKRYDIAAICLAFYTFFSLQNALWACREVHIAILFYFALLQYFLTKEELNWKDYIPILLIIVYLFESFEITMVFGIILFIFSILFIEKKKTEYNRWHKAIIGVSGFLMFLYVPIKLMFWHFLNQINLNAGSSEWINASVETLHSLFNSNSLITVFSLIVLIFISFFKKEFCKKHIPFIFMVVSVFMYILWKKTHYICNPPIELQNYSFAFWFIFPVIITLLIMEYKNKEFNSVFLSNLIVTSCIIGIIGLFWQINTCFEFHKYTSYLKNLMANTEGVFIKIPQEDDKNEFFLNFNLCYGLTHTSLLLSDDFKIKKIVVPAEYYHSYSPFCFSLQQEGNNFYNPENNSVYLQQAPLKLQTKYWDLSILKDEIEEFNNQYFSSNVPTEAH